MWLSPLWTASISCQRALWATTLLLVVWPIAVEADLCGTGAWSAAQPARCAAWGSWGTLSLEAFTAVLYSVLCSGLSTGTAAGRISRRGNLRWQEDNTGQIHCFLPVSVSFPHFYTEILLGKQFFFFYSCCACDYKQKCWYVCGPLEWHFPHSCIELGSCKHGKVFSEISFFTNVCHQTATGIQRTRLNNGEKCQWQTECWIPGGCRLKREGFWQLIEI